ncbi:hypothetical protein N8D76_13160 [Curtobacterium poinsettiae]|nr:hypothetical protein [Curtobacterium flaccumfaciens]UXN14366.1 hypothetical protein N8D76_13160 [Curtobacterium flaccumfaciens pv. poinsettiae]
MKLAIRNLHRAGVRQVHVLGDFGFLSTGNRHERDRLRLLTMQLESRDMFLYVTGGNHEGYPALHRLFPVDEWGYRRLSRRIIWLPRGWRGTTAAGAAVASLGGANSINRGRRDPSVSGLLQRGIRRSRSPRRTSKHSAQTRSTCSSATTHQSAEPSNDM